MSLIIWASTTELSTLRVKRILAKASNETANALRQILVDIASESARKAIWG
ncbi:MAG: DUF2321 domain-containing protein [Dehalococcoidia bacterium]|nr:DUF2321 domain-containing protein [Dehalococcoidia bacterium]